MAGISQLLSVKSSIPQDEVLPLAAYGQFLKGEFEGVHIITKGGSQGNKDAINKCITYLKEKLYI